MNALRPSRSYRVSGADNASGKDVEITVAAFDEADATRTANRQGIFVSSCVAAAAEGTFAQAVSSSPVAHKLLGRFPQLGFRLRRLNDEDQAYLCDLTHELNGVSHRESGDMARLIQDNRHLPRT